MKETWKVGNGFGSDMNQLCLQDPYLDAYGPKLKKPIKPTAKNWVDHTPRPTLYHLLIDPLVKAIVDASTSQDKGVRSFAGSILLRMNTKRVV